MESEQKKSKGKKKTYQVQLRENYIATKEKTGPPTSRTLDCIVKEGRITLPRTFIPSV